MKTKIYTITVVEKVDGGTTSLVVEIPKIPRFAKENILRELLQGESIVELKLKP